MSSTSPFSSAYHFPASHSSSSDFMCKPATSQLSLHSATSSNQSSLTNSTASKAIGLLKHIEVTETEYIDDLYLLLSYLSSNNQLFKTVEQIIQISSVPYLNYIFPSACTPTTTNNWIEWVSSSSAFGGTETNSQIA